jgi:hypothetical protein
MELKEIANLKIKTCDIGENVTIEDYLKKLLEALWREDECFSGKRPFGNSGWKWDIYSCLVESEVIVGEFDEDGYVADFDEDEGDKIIFTIISALTIR